MTYTCPVDGRELQPGQACPEHRIAFGKPEPAPPAKAAPAKKGRKA
jgi:hypothetical protein